MSALERVVRHVEGVTAAESTKWALVGGFAVAARAEPRFTRDLDVAVADDGEAERVVQRFRDVGFTATGIVEQQAVGRQSPQARRRGSSTVM